MLLLYTAESVKLCACKWSANTVSLCS